MMVQFQNYLWWCNRGVTVAPSLGFRSHNKTMYTKHLIEEYHFSSRKDFSAHGPVMTARSMSSVRNIFLFFIYLFCFVFYSISYFRIAFLLNCLSSFSFWNNKKTRTRTSNENYTHERQNEAVTLWAWRTYQMQGMGSPLCKIPVKMGGLLWVRQFSFMTI